MEEDIILCDCFSSEHQILLIHDLEDKQVYAHVLLNRFHFWKRLWVGIKYIFGYRCRYGMFEEFIFNKEHINKLKRVIQTIDEI